MFDTIELWSLRSVFGVSASQAQHITLAHHRGLDLRKVGSSSQAVLEHAQQGGKERRLRKAIAEVGRRSRGGQKPFDSLSSLSIFFQARATGQLLDAAVKVAQDRLQGAQALRAQFEHILETKSGADVQLGSMLPAALKKVRADASVLSKAVVALRELDPLGQSLAPASNEATDDTERGFDGTNRDEYLHWEVKRALNEQNKDEPTSANEANPAAKRKSTGLASKAAGKKAKIGTTAELEVSCCR